LSVPIDVWDTETFDQELISKLRASEQLVRDYLTTDRRQFEEREASDRWMPYASNPYASEYLGITVTVHPITSLRLRQGFQLNALSP
jgi:hypothetical protein